MKLDKVTPCGNMVLLRMVEQKKADEYKTTASGIIIPNSETATNVATTNKGEKKTVIVYVEAIGNLVDQSKITFKVGDEIMYNSYDLITIGDDTGALYGLTKAESILAVIEASGR